MQSNLHYDWKLKVASPKIAISPAKSNKSQTLIRKLSFTETMDFEQSTDESSEFQIGEINNSPSCFKKLSFAAPEDDFPLPTLQNKFSYYSSFSMEAQSYDNEEDSFKLFGSSQDTIMEEEEIPSSTNDMACVIKIQQDKNGDICFDNISFGPLSFEKQDSLQPSSFSFEEKTEFFEESEPKEGENMLPGSCVPMIPSLETKPNLRDPDLWTISSQTLVNLMKDKNKRFLIIDCRYDYEYKGGHIEGAVNIESLESLERLLFTNRHLLHDNNYLNKIKEDLQKLFADSHLIDPETTNMDSQDPPILIFHCEFSQKRGPRALRALRNLDRHLNAHRWPSLFYSEVYVLEDGYQSFHTQFPEHSYPKNSYVKMLDKNYKSEFAKAKERERKSWKKTDSIKQCLTMKTYLQRSKTATYS